MSVTEAPLLRLRVSFVALGLLLLVALAGLLHFAVSRLDEQRALRHEMIAERVFDEVEREISSLLQHEAERSSTAYDAVDTDPQRWSPFIVGYYRRDTELHVVASGKLAPARLARVREAVERTRGALDATSPTRPAVGGPAIIEDEHEAGAALQSPDVLRQLNRSVKVRERRQKVLAALFTVAPAARDTLVLERRSPDHDRREGFVLDVPTLVATIQSWVLGAQGLDAVAVLHASMVPSVEPGTYVFTHQLAAPLDSERVSLKLSRLGDQDAGLLLYSLAALLAASALLGLWAIYRTVAVQVRFAERRNNFVAAVTHELKTPLTSIRMYGELLRDGMVEDERTRNDYYAIITAEGERLTRLINNVMEHGKLRKGDRPTYIVHRDPGELVVEVLDLMRAHIESERVTVQRVIDPDLPSVAVDVDAFKQVLFNVLDNALKYGCSEDSRTLEVHCRAERGGAVISVRDFGPGVPPEQLKTVFEPFFRGQDELTRKRQGTGLGLSLVRDLVTLMNGQVEGIHRSPGFEVRIVLSGG